MELDIRCKEVAMGTAADTPRVVREFPSQGVETSIPDYSGATPLHAEAQHGSHFSHELLFQHATNLDPEDND